MNGQRLLILKEPNVSQVLEVISDEISIDILRNIQKNAESRNELKSGLNINSKQLYDRVHKLMTAGLVKRKKSYYYITSFGRAAIRAHSKIAKGIEYFPELKIVDSITNGFVPREAYAELMDRLVDDIELKEIISKHDMMYEKEATS
jgi:DNA-binding HxlR family transcriptional regulator